MRICFACCSAAGQTFLEYTFGTAKEAGFNTFRMFALAGFLKFLNPHPVISLSLSSFVDFEIVLQVRAVAPRQDASSSERCNDWTACRSKHSALVVHLSLAGCRETTTTTATRTTARSSRCSPSRACTMRPSSRPSTGSWPPLTPPASRFWKHRHMKTFCLHFVQRHCLHTHRQDPGRHLRPQGAA
jgi:hypothetical protein